MRTLIMVIPTLILSGCGNPGGISDADYNEYQQLGAPKILYSMHNHIRQQRNEAKFSMPG